MKRISFIIALAIVAVALVAVMVACDPSGDTSQQAYFNNNDKDVALLYETGTVKEAVGVINGGESATYDVAIANKYDPATLTATAKNAKISLTVTGSVDPESTVENGYTVVGQLTISDVTETASISFSAEEADIEFTVKLSENASEAALTAELLDSFNLSDGQILRMTYSELDWTDGLGIVISGAVNGNYRLYDGSTGESAFISDNGLVTGFFDHISEARNQYKIWLDAGVMQMSNEIIFCPENCSKETLYVSSVSGSIIEIEEPVDVDLTVDNLEEVTVRLLDTDGNRMTGTVCVNGSAFEIKDAQSGVKLDKLPIEYYSAEDLQTFIENGAGGMFAQTYNISAEVDLVDNTDVVAFKTSVDDAGIKFEPRYMSAVYYYDENGTAWVARNYYNEAEYIVDFALYGVADGLDYVVTVTYGGTVKEFNLNEMYELTDPVDSWVGLNDITYLTDGTAEENIKIAKYVSGGKIQNVYVCCIAEEGHGEYEINFR